MKIAVIGTGYVGLVTGVVLAHMGNDVVCVDNDLEKVGSLRNGVPTIYEPGIEEMLKRTLADERLTISDSVAEATRASEIVFIAVGTPPGPDGTPDVAAVRAVATLIGQNITKYTVIVNKSTVPVGSGAMVEDIIASQGAPVELFDVVSNPEFLREGSAIHDTLFPDRIVIGAKKREAANKLVELYAGLEKPMYITDLESAELIKYGSNSFLAMKISFINAMSRICEAAGANVADVAKGMGADQRIGPQFLGAGLGWGGSCFPKDVRGLITTAERLGYDFGLLKAVEEINESQPIRFLDRLDARLGGLKRKRIAMLGLAFKANTDDIRDARSLVLIDAILARGGKVRAYDPVAESHVRKLFPQIDYADNVLECVRGAHAILLVTEWNEFRQIDLKRLAEQMERPLLFDGRRIYSRAAAEKAGFEYHTIGS